MRHWTVPARFGALVGPYGVKTAAHSYPFAVLAFVNTPLIVASSNRMRTPDGLVAETSGCGTQIWNVVTGPTVFTNTGNGVGGCP